MGKGPRSVGHSKDPPRTWYTRLRDAPNFAIAPLAIAVVLSIFMLDFAYRNEMFVTMAFLIGLWVFFIVVVFYIWWRHRQYDQEFLPIVIED